MTQLLLDFLPVYVANDLCQSYSTYRSRTDMQNVNKELLLDIA